MAEVIAVVENQSVKTKITYSKPMVMNQESEFALTPEGESTKMSWIVKGDKPFIGKLMCLITFTNMDKYVGGMFERGLVKLKSLAESR